MGDADQTTKIKGMFDALSRSARNWSPGFGGVPARVAQAAKRPSKM
jgi:hypothetical protein